MLFIGLFGIRFLSFIGLLSSSHLCFRYRSGGGKSQNQNELTVEELRCFVQQLDNLPCNIRQAPLLKVSVFVLDLCMQLFLYYLFIFLSSFSFKHS